MQDKKVYTEIAFFKICVAAAAVVISIGSYLVLTGTLPWYFLLLAIFFSFLLLVILRQGQLTFDRIRQHHYDYQQLESLFSIYHHLQPQTVLPSMRKYAGSPDFLNLVLDELKSLQPKLVVEASSGVSSIVISEYLAEHLPLSRHLALEHEEKYAQLTRAKIRHTHSEILHTPLTSYDLDGQSYQWYDVSQLDKDLEIDLLVVDGPPKHLNDKARYPALPVLAAISTLPKVIILDDADRPDEKEIIEQWATRYGYAVQYFYLEKGGVVLRKQE